MLARQNMMHTITQAAKAAMMAVKEEENSVKSSRSVQVIPITGRPALKQPTFDWKWQINTKDCKPLR